MICEQCLEPAMDVLPDGEPACPECLSAYWERVLEQEGMAAELQRGSR
jgi:hypothetical protein